MPRRLAMFLVAVAVFALDRWSKWWVETRLTAWDTKVVVPGFFNIVSSRNTGVAFGWFAESPMEHRTALLIAFSVVAVVLLAVLLWRMDKADGRTAIGLALIFGGAVGNVFDRIRFGMVTDFLDFYAGSYHWYTFNVADTAISVGAGLMLLSMLRQDALPEKNARPTHAS